MTDRRALNGLIVRALRDGLAADVLAPARHLATIDPNRLRGATRCPGVTLLQLGQHDEARRVLEEATARHGDDGVVLTNLAKAYAGLGDTAKSDQTLWRALEVDPNQDNGLLWYVALHKERGGAAGEAAALARVAALPASWRAQLWLARAALARNGTDAAVRLYREVLGQVTPVPTDALMQISGDLGNRGQLALIVELCGPRFDIGQHGMTVGNNLIKANLDMGRADEARQLVEALYAQQRPDWRETLLDWERRIDDAEKRYGPVEGQLKLGFRSIDLPLWAHSRLGFEALLPAKGPQAPRVTFICGTGERPGPKATQAQAVRTDALGRVTRALPFHLAEEIHLTTSAQARVQVIGTDNGGFALLEYPLDVETLAKAQVEGDVVVLLHVDARSAPWQLMFSIVRWADKVQLASWSVPFTVEQPLAGLRAALERLRHDLAVVPGLQPAPIPPLLRRPDDANLAGYVSGLENALIITMAVASPSGKPAIWGERAMIDTLLDLAVQTPADVRARLLLINSVDKEGRRRPDIAREYLEKLALLQQRHPLPAGPAADLAAAGMEKLRAPRAGAARGGFRARRRQGAGA